MREVHQVPFITAALGTLAYFFYAIWRGHRKHSDPPQKHFRILLADNSDKAFVHLEPADGDSGPHPYHGAIQKLMSEPLCNVRVPRQCALPCPLEAAPLVLVETPSDLVELVSDVSKARAIAVDTEHHASHCYLGLTCLLQISTGVTDYVVDTLALHDHMSQLRGVFADPDIVKVFHGGGNDVLWLQRDFHIYVVNMFDTEKACQVLGKEQRGLGHLLRHYCGVEPQKQFQQADWRIRPLPSDMLQYACTDVHYLLYLADMLKGELLGLTPVGDDLMSVEQPDRVAFAEPEGFGGAEGLCEATGSVQGHVVEEVAGTQLETELSHSSGLVTEVVLVAERQDSLLALLPDQEEVENPFDWGDVNLESLPNNLDPSEGQGDEVLDEEWACLSRCNTDKLAAAIQKSHQVSLSLYQKQSSDCTAAAAASVLFRRYKQHLADNHKINTHEGREGGLGTQEQHQVGGSPVQIRCRTSSPTELTSPTGLDLSSADLSLSPTGPVRGSRSEAEVVRDCIYALCVWRDKQARLCDVHPTVVMGHRVLLALAERRPASARGVVSLTRQLGDEERCGGTVPPWCSTSETLPVIKRQAAEIQKLLHEAEAGVRPWVGSRSALQLTSAQHRQKQEDEEERRRRMIRKFSAKSEVYQNCRILSQDGELLCYCDLRKLQWYVKKGLGEQVAEEPPTIRLLFEHKNADQRTGMDRFYSCSKANKCVVCGESEHYLRYRVVPSCYRRRFPTEMKSHRSHDVVLLCVDCHQVAHKAAEQLKRQIAQEYGIPLQPPRTVIQAAYLNDPFDSTNVPMDHHAKPSRAPGGDDQQQRGPDAEDAAVEEHCQDMADIGPVLPEGLGGGGGHVEPYGAQGSSSLPPHPNMVRRAAVALVAFGDKLPEDRKMEYERTVKMHLGRDPLSQAPLSAADLEVGLVAGLGAKKRAKMMQRVRRKKWTEDKAARAEEQSQADAQRAADLGLSSHQNGLTVCDSQKRMPGVRAVAAARACNSTISDESLERPLSHYGDETVSGAGPLLHGGSPSTGLDPATLGQGGPSTGLDPATLDQGGHMWHGQKVVDAAMAKGGLEDLQILVTRFRQGFVAACRPRFLPPSWQVDHLAVREFGEYSVYSKVEV